MNETIGPESRWPVQWTDRLQRLATNLSGVVDPASMAQQAVAQVQAALDADAGVVFLLSPDGESLQIAHASGYEARTTGPWTRFPLTVNLPVTDAVRPGRRCWCARGRNWSSGTRSWPPRRARSSAVPGPPFRWWRTTCASAPSGSRSDTATRSRLRRSPSCGWSRTSARRRCTARTSPSASADRRHACGCWRRRRGCSPRRATTSHPS